MVVMVSALVVGAIVLVGAVVARVTWRRSADERQSVREHQHTLETLRHMADRRQEGARSVPVRGGARRGASLPYGGGAPRPASRQVGAASGRPTGASARRAPRVPVEVPEVPDTPGRRSPGRPGASRAGSRTSRLALPVGIAAVAGAVALGLALSQPSHPSRSAGHAAAASRPGGPRGDGAAGSTTTAPADTAVVPVSRSASSATYAAPATTYTVALDASGPCWVSATDGASGTVLWTGTMTAGQSHSLSADGAVAVRLGAASDVTLSMDGRPVQFPAGFQSPFTATFQPA